MDTLILRRSVVLFYYKSDKFHHCLTGCDAVSITAVRVKLVDAALSPLMLTVFCILYSLIFFQTFNNLMNVSKDLFVF